MSNEIWFGAFEWATTHQHRSRGCKSVTCQSWRSERISLRLLFCLVKRGSNRSRVKSFLDLQIWYVTVLQPLELWWQIVPHFLKNSMLALLRYVSIAQQNVKIFVKLFNKEILRTYYCETSRTAPGCILYSLATTNDAEIFLLPFKRRVLCDKFSGKIFWTKLLYLVAAFLLLFSSTPQDLRIVSRTSYKLL